MIKVYCDGACSGNPGPGGWAYVAFENEKIIASASGKQTMTTNNQMELVAAIKALEAFDNVEVVLDSKYVKNGITIWINKWKINGWKTASGNVKNVELWKELDSLALKRNIKWSWEKGHNNTDHDHADKLARQAIFENK